MADVSHNALTGTELHEPKGIATATLGDVYVANGSGSGTWSVPGGAVYGEMAITNNVTTVALVDSGYTKIDTGIWTAGQVEGVTYNASNYLEILTAGVYEISFWSSFTYSVNSTVVTFKFSTDDTVNSLSSRSLSRKVGIGTDVGAVAASSFAPLSVGDKLSLFATVDSGNSGNITIANAGFTATLLKAT